MFVEKSGLGPADGVKIAVDTSGAVEVITGGASIGQGFETVMAQVAPRPSASTIARVRVTHGQTDRIEFGIGAHASRATVMTASATHVAALKLRDKALDMAAQLMQAAPGDLDIVGGVVRRKDGAGASIPLGAVATALLPTSKTLAGREPGLSAEGWFEVERQVYPYGSHVAVVKVDAETGGVTVERYVIGYDVGRAINPMLVRGQIVGGFTQGLGGALMEEFRYSENGDPLSRDLRRLSDADRARDAGRRDRAHRGLPDRPQSARHQGRRRKRHHRRRRRDRVRGRRRHRHAGRDHRAADHAGTGEGDLGGAQVG